MDTTHQWFASVEMEKKAQELGIPVLLYASLELGIPVLLYASLELGIPVLLYAWR